MMPTLTTDTPMMSRVRATAVLTGLLVAATNVSVAHSQAPNLVLGTAHVIHSARLKSDRRLLVSTPDAYAADQRRYPVLVLLDGDDQFRNAVATVRFFANRQVIPDMIIIGVPNGADRTHDLTPRLIGKDTMNFKTAGGADDFLVFLSDEVLPWVDKRYRTLPTRVLAGHSFGGLIALYAAAKQPSAFRVTVAMSPALWWNDTASATDYADMLARSTAGPRTLFVTSGTLEPPIDRPTLKFAETLRARLPESLRFEHRHYIGEGHGTTPFVSLVDGLRWAFAPLAIPMDSLAAALLATPHDSATFANTFARAVANYARASAAVGLDAEIPEAARNAFGYMSLQGGHKRLAVHYFRENVHRFSDSPNVYDSLGDGLLAAGDTVGARAQFAEAVRRGTIRKDPIARESRRKLALLAAARAKP